MSLIEKAGKKLDLPLEYAAGAHRVELTGTGEVRIEQHRGVTHYAPELIIVKGVGADIRIKGADLTLKMMTDDEIRVDVRIDGIELGQ